VYDVRELELEEWNQRSPIQGLRRDSLQFIPLFPPRSPTSVLKPHAIGNLVLLSCHVTP
jgi:hypothetical protein